MDVWKEGISSVKRKGLVTYIFCIVVEESNQHFQLYLSGTALVRFVLLDKREV